MPEFTKLNPNDVVLGRGRSALEARKPYVEALQAGDAGRVDLQRGDRPTVVKSRLAEAAKELGVKVQSSWTDDAQRSLIWRKTGRR